MLGLAGPENGAPRASLAAAAPPTAPVRARPLPRLSPGYFWDILCLLHLEHSRSVCASRVHHVACVKTRRHAQLSGCERGFAALRAALAAPAGPSDGAGHCASTAHLSACGAGRRRSQRRPPTPRTTSSATRARRTNRRCRRRRETAQRLRPRRRNPRRRARGPRTARGAARAAPTLTPWTTCATCPRCQSPVRAPARRAPWARHAAPVRPAPVVGAVSAAAAQRRCEGGRPPEHCERHPALQL